MIKFIAKRLGSGLVVLFVVSVLTFTLLYTSSGSIAQNILGDQATPEQVALKEQELGLDQPLFVRYFAWLGDALTGNLGASWFTSEPVASSLATRIPVTMTMVFTAMILIAICAALIGVAAAVKRGWVDRVVQIGAIVGDSIPGYVIGVFLVTILAIQLGFFPATSTISPEVGPEAWVYSMTLPVIALLINGVTGGAQQIRSAVIKQLERDYVRTLRSRGIGEREILFKHVLRSAAPAGLTVLSLQLIGMLGGVVIIEQIFALPGMGPLAVAATTQTDLPVVMGVVMYTVVVVIVVNLLVDILNGWLNPKVRVS
ncbi:MULTISPECIES: ABC transporter permease [Micrococcaceae]|uniref:ABC transporter permease n=1 Tax=Micrococcaceae TaxID=1268 RepID=UPI0014232792|nr:MULTISPECIES: ABC transporter permease [Micrococcaceae]MCM0617894.1 ABC transporter permease [Paenarthrobacter sp. TYUT067]NHW46725.1 ABC transporter permease [Paenarthrobacter sp. MSM-2-10-13]NWL13019.1 ABC transporter permease [Paenarthrobacter nitroguajacolicus]NWL33676.1 ABC transporter permease [Paenarthrobacter nitroguajacolicus]BCW61543.1 ABC transporter permease [Arthrobacter sp. StoSoilB22]